MRRIATTVVALMLLWMGAAGAQQAKPDSGGFRVKPTLNFYLALEIWPDVGADDDSKLGFGIGGTIGVAFVVNDTRLVVGPHFGYNLWTANYSSKPNSYTQSVTFGMADVGAELEFTMDNLVLYLGKGTSTMAGSMLLDDGTTFRYPGLDGEQFSYNTVGVGYVSKRFTLGMLHTSYPGAAKDASRLEVRLALGF